MSGRSSSPAPGASGRPVPPAAAAATLSAASMEAGSSVGLKPALYYAGVAAAVAAALSVTLRLWERRMDVPFLYAPGRSVSSCRWACWWRRGCL